MSAKVTGALALILILLCAGYALMIFLESSHKQAVEEAKRLFTYSSGDITKLEVTRLGEQPVSGMRDDKGAWTITAPSSDIEPNPIVWERLAKAVAELANQRTIDAEAKTPDAYGLKEPVTIVTASAKDGATVKIALGDEDPAQLGRYAQVLEGANTGIFLITTEAFHELDRPLLDLRNRFLLNVTEPGITHLEFALFWRGSEKDAEAAKARGLNIGDESVAVVLEREKDTPWRMIAPETGPANQDQANALVKEIQFAVGRDFVDNPSSLADYGLEPPVARITVACGNNPAQTILFGSLEKDAGKDSGLYVKRASAKSVCVMDSNIIALFPRAVDAFRERRLFSGKASDLRRIHYQTNGVDITLANDPKTGWSIAEPPTPDADPVALSSFIAMLKELQGIKFPTGVDQAAMGFDAPLIRVSMTLEGNPNPAEICIGAPVPNETTLYARQDSGIPITIARDTVNHFTWTMLDFRVRRLMSLKKEKVTSLDLTFETITYRLEKNRNRWLIREPENYIIESLSDVESLLDAAGLIRATSVEAPTAPKDLAAYGLDQPLAILTITAGAIDEQGQPIEIKHGPLTIGAPCPDNDRQRFALAAGHPELFRIDQDVVDAIRAALRGIHAK